MPTPKEILRTIKKKRGDWFRYTRNRPASWCMLIENVVVDNLPNAHFWESSVRRHERDYRGHYVAVIGTRRDHGIIVQFSGANPEDNEIILGSVRNIHDQHEVEKMLVLKTGRGGWKQRY